VRRVDIPLLDPPQQLIQLDVENVQLHAHALRSCAQAQGVALLPAPQAEIEAHSSFVRRCAFRSTASRRASVVLPEPGSPQVRCSVGST